MSQNPLLIQAALDCIKRRREQESLDPVLLARRAGIMPDLWQQQVLRSAARQIIMLVTRQGGKSTISSIRALHKALYSPGSLVLLLAPSYRQSKELFRKVKDAYNTLPASVPLLSESALELELKNNSRIVALPGKEETIRGFSGVALLIVDEAARVSDALYQAVRPMLAVSGGQIVLLSTPFGRRGFFHEVWEHGGLGWHRTKITAAECPRIAPAWLEQERQQIGEFWFTQEYECSFNDDVSAVFRYEDILAAADGNITPDWSIGNALG